MFGGFTDPLGVRGLGVGEECPIKPVKNIRDKPNQVVKRKKPSKQPSIPTKQKNGKNVTKFLVCLKFPPFRPVSFSCLFCGRYVVRL